MLCINISIYSKKVIAYTSLCLCLVFFTNCAYCQVGELGVIHLHSTIGRGIKTISQYAQMAEEQGIKVIIITDHAVLRWEYGLPPLRRLLRKRIKQPSVFEYGVKNYLGRIEEVDASYPELIVLAGVQVTPFYYWEGSLFKKNLTLINGQKDLLVIGLGKAIDYENMPLIGNRRSRFDQYHGDKGVAPYQDLIDYVVSKDGLIFWSHPETDMFCKWAGANSYTPPYTSDLLNTYNYTGFAIFPEGYKVIGKVGGVWDRVLMEYCQGRRRRPIWAIGELIFHGLGASKDLDNVLTVFLIPRVTERAVLGALKNGRMYAISHCGEGPMPVVENFSVGDVVSGKRAMMGGEVSSSGKVRIKIDISYTEQVGEEIKVKVIRNGEVVKEFVGTGGLKVDFIDTYFMPGEKVYYRFEANDGIGNILIANPIFVSFIQGI